MCVLLKIIFNKSKNMRVVLYSTIFLILLAFSPWGSEPFELTKLMLFVAIPAIVLFFWFAIQVLKGEVTFWRTPLDLPLLLLLLVTGASFFFSQDTPGSLFGTQGRFHDGIFGTIGFIALYFFATQARVSWKNAMRVLVGVGVVLAVLSYLAFFGVEQAGVFPLSMVTLLFAVLAVFLIGRGGAVFGFIPDFLLLAMFVGLLFLANSFGAWFLLLSGLCASLFLGVWNRVRLKEAFSLRKLWLPLLLAVVSLVMLLAFVPNNSLGLSLDAPADSLRQLVIGSGPGTLRVVEDHASQVLLNTGVLGGLAWLLVFFSFLLFAFFLRSPFLAAGFALLVSQFFYPSSTLMLFVSSLILGVGASTFEKVNYPLKLSLKKFFEVRVAFFAALILFGGALAFLSPWAFKWYRADMLYAKSVETRDASFVLKAQELVPMHTDYKLLAGNLLFQKVLSRYAGSREARQTVDEEEQDASTLSLRVQQALVLVKNASELSPNRADVWEALGTLYAEISFAPGALDWAIQSFDKAISLEPKNYSLYTKQSALLRKKEKLGDARKALDMALSLQFNSRAAQLENILLLEAEGKKEEALRVAKELSLRFPSDAKVLFELGRMYFNNEEWKSASEKFELVLEQQPNNSDARYSLALALEKQGNKTRAIQELERVLELNPGKEEVLQKLEQLQKK